MTAHQAVCEHIVCHEGEGHSAAGRGTAHLITSLHNRYMFCNRASCLCTCFQHIQHQSHEQLQLTSERWHTVAGSCS